LFRGFFFEHMFEVNSLNHGTESLLLILIS
jgi:hypothetical protein